MYRARGKGAFVDAMARHGISARALAENSGRWVVMTRRSLLGDYVRAGVQPNSQDAWCWSMWRGYLAERDGASLQQWFDASGTPACHIHSSGHASTADLQEFAQRMQAARLVPIHGEAWDSGAAGFPPLTRLADGEPLILA